MLQTPFPPKEEIQIEAAWTPWQLLVSITTNTSLKLMQLREQLQRRSLGGGAVHACEEHHGIAVQRLSGWPAHGSRLEQWRPRAAHLS
tara:strand:+ start:208 stop:471 length:264 start_codon:yes stop_codon:yes gene_type:complete